MSMGFAAQAVTLPADLRAAIHNSMTAFLPMTVTYIDDKGRGVTTYRGSTHVHDDGTLAIWVRSRQGGLQRAAESGNQLSLAYRNPFTRSFVHLQGIASLETDGDINARIYEESPPPEKMADIERKGIGVLVRLSRVAGTFEGRKIELGG